MHSEANPYENALRHMKNALGHMCLKVFFPRFTLLTENPNIKTGFVLLGTMRLKSQPLQCALAVRIYCVTDTSVLKQHA
jgi:hypothetical protein